MNNEREGKGIKSIEVPRQRSNISQSKVQKDKQNISKSKDYLYVPLKDKFNEKYENRILNNEYNNQILRKAIIEEKELSVEEKLVDYNEKETFSNLVSFAKKGDRVSFMKSIEE